MCTSLHGTCTQCVLSKHYIIQHIYTPQQHLLLFADHIEHEPPVAIPSVCPVTTTGNILCSVNQAHMHAY